MILDDIVTGKRKELVRTKTEMPLRELEARIAQRAAPLDFAGALRGEGVSIIAEVKKASPSKGLLCPDFDPVSLAKAYAEGGAAAISVLTEVNHFQGHLNYLSQISELPELEEIPLLRKDFIFDPYQVYEARAFGADAILLIAAILEDRELDKLMALARELGMQCLVEVHDGDELDKALQGSAQIIGINNRDLRTFEVDVHTTRRLRSLIPLNRVVVSESGVSRREDIERFREWSIDAALIGEALVTADDVIAKLRELL
ncbi:MAG: indole-3-glycerol phosphate synthase TrpC [Dehalococcoidales bacterium]|nr:MAG: indole-3-glycerol phosphate synthase TrpC [Dehalococcoidales bacterium]